MTTHSEPESFGHFFRRYTKTWMHAVAAAGLTAFGAFTFVHRGFVVVALACYVVPPVVLYLSRSRGSDASGARSTSPTDAALRREGEPDSGSDESAERGTLERESFPSEAQSASDRGSASRETTTETAGASTTEPAGTSSESTIESTEAGEPDRDSVSTANPGRESAVTAEEESVTGTDREPVSTTGTSDAAPEWTVVDSPTGATLFDVAVADGRAVAVGSGGVVLESAGGDWDVLLEDGPAAQAQDLRGVDATADGEAVWMAGDGGAVARLETATGRHTDHSAPDDRTDNLAGVAVAGASADETVLLINGSGEVLRGRYRDGELSWDEPAKPGSGSSLSGVTLADDTVGYCCDTSDGVFETDDAGRTFETVGIDGADGTLTGVAAGGQDDCHASTDAGVVHRYDGSRWTPERVCEGALTGIDRHDERLVVCDADGVVHDRLEPTADWKRFDADSSGGLESVAIGSSRAVAVGGDGTVVERG